MIEIKDNKLVIDLDDIGNEIHDLYRKYCNSKECIYCPCQDDKHNNCYEAYKRIVLPNDLAKTIFKDILGRF